MLCERRDGLEEKQRSVAAGSSLAQLLETALEAPHQANIWLLRNPGQCYVLVQWKQCLVLLWAPSCLSLCDQGGQEEDAWNFLLYSPFTVRPAGVVTEHPAVGEVVPEPFRWLWRGYSASCSSCFPFGMQQQVLGFCVLLLDQTQGRWLHVLPSEPLNHSAQLKD